MISIPPQAIAAVAGLAIAFAGGWMLQGWRMGTRIAELTAQHATIVADAERKARDAVDAARQREAALVTQTEEIVHGARQAIQDLQRDAAAADAARGGLLDAARRAASRCATAADPAAGGRGAAAGVPGSVSDAERLLRVLGELDGAAGAYAAAADRSRAAGAACERAYDAARGALTP